MILYSKSGEFLGIGREELSFLGYEDLEEFKNVNDDVADLFVNRPGYIFKFKNFSWIDYALHSGAPKKSVILKLKTGNEVETAIKIKELFLNNPQGNEDIHYCIEFTNAISQNSAINPEPSYTKQSLSSFVPFEEKISEEKKTNEEEEPKIEINSLVHDFEEDKEEKTSYVFEDNEVEKNEAQFKLKTDDNILFEEENNAQSIEINNFDQDYTEETSQNKEEIKPEDEEKFIKQESYIVEQTTTTSNFDNETSIKTLKINDLEQDYTEESSTNKEKTNIIAPSTLENNVNIKEEDEIKTTEFDILKCVEEVGLDIGLISELITEYIEKLDRTIPKIKSSIKENDDKSLKNDIYKLKGISDNLCITHLSDKLVDILSAKTLEDKNKEVENFEKIVTTFKGEFI